MSRHRRRQNRSGTALVESALILSLVLTLLFSLLEFSLAVMRYNGLSYAARAVARQVIVHGAKANVAQGSWGPAPYSGHGGDAHVIAQTAAPWLVTITPADVSISVTWLDDDNEIGDRVEVRLTYLNSPTIPWLGLGATQLAADCAMRIVH